MEQEEDLRSSDSDSDTVIDVTGDKPKVINGRYVNVVWVLNNYTEEEIAVIKAMLVAKCKWLIYSKEIGASGTPHLQGYMKLKNKTSLSTLRGYLPRAHFEKAGGTDEQNYQYVTKTRPIDQAPNRQEDVFEFGTRPRFVRHNGEREVLRWQDIWENAKQRNLELIPKQVLVGSYSNITKIGKDYMQMPPDAPEVTGVWIQGPSGIGKSRKARQDYPGAYMKPCNKWWDGYQNQLYAIIDDFDKSHAILGHYLKIWGDRYSFTAESKGSAMAIRPLKVVVTSQYRIDDIWQDQETIDAIKRRFQVIDLFPPQVYPIFVHPTNATPPRAQVVNIPTATIVVEEDDDIENTQRLN